jgi:putative transposase
MRRSRFTEAQIISILRKRAAGAKTSEVVAFASASAALQERVACRFLGTQRSFVRYRARPSSGRRMRERLRTLASEKLRWGSPRLTWLLGREGR